MINNARTLADILESDGGSKVRLNKPQIEDAEIAPGNSHSVIWGFGIRAIGLQESMHSATLGQYSEIFTHIRLFRELMNLKDAGFLTTGAESTEIQKITGVSMH